MSEQFAAIIHAGNVKFPAADQKTDNSDISPAGKTISLYIMPASTILAITPAIVARIAPVSV